MEKEDEKIKQDRRMQKHTKNRQLQTKQVPTSAINTMQAGRGKKREYRYDTLKFFMMLLVVYGHILYYFLDDFKGGKGIYYFIYSFHIPVFLFLSGMFAIPTLIRKDWCKPVCYIFLYCLMKVGIQVVKSIKTETLKIHFFWDNTPAWYFLVIAVYLILTTKLRQRIGTQKLLLYSLFFACIARYDNHFGDHFASMRIVTFYPFFWLESCIAKK